MHHPSGDPAAGGPRLSALDAEARPCDVDVAPFERAQFADPHPRLFEHAQGKAPAPRRVLDDLGDLRLARRLDHSLLDTRELDPAIPSGVRINVGEVEHLSKRRDVLLDR